MNIGRRSNFLLTSEIGSLSEAAAASRIAVMDSSGIDLDVAASGAGVPATATDGSPEI